MTITMMTCAQAGQLAAAHVDAELPLDVQIAFEAHLHGCARCADAVGPDVAALRRLGEVLREATHEDRGAGHDSETIQSTVISRIRAEEDQTVLSRVRRVLDDRRRVGAVMASAAVALAWCGVSLFGLLQSAEVKPDSLAELIDALVTKPRVRSAPLVLPRANVDAVMPITVLTQVQGDDVELAFRAVILPDGWLSGIEILPSTKVDGAVLDERLLMHVLEAASTAKFEPARVGGAAVPLSVVWMVTHTTVRGRVATSGVNEERRLGSWRAPMPTAAEARDRQLV